jgi:hypothetical protein
LICIADPVSDENMKNTPNKGWKEKAGKKQDVTIGQRPTDARPSQLDRRDREETLLSSPHPQPVDRHGESAQDPCASVDLIP